MLGRPGSAPSCRNRVHPPAVRAEHALTDLWGSSRGAAAVLGPSVGEFRGVRGGVLCVEGRPARAERRLMQALRAVERAAVFARRRRRAEVAAVAVGIHPRQ